MSLLGKAIEKRREENLANRRAGGRADVCYECEAPAGKYGRPDERGTLCGSCYGDREAARRAVRKQDEGLI